MKEGAGTPLDQELVKRLVAAIRSQADLALLVIPVSHITPLVPPGLSLTSRVLIKYANFSSHQIMYIEPK